ncbi:MAG: SLC13 family permease [Chloroflexota bacterium]|nr:SLC13 family permease [Chloroflexota bacterium]
MSLEAWATLAIVVALLVVMAREVLQPAFAVLLATISLMLLGIISPAQAFSGFSNEAPIAVAALLVVARAVDVSGVFQPIVRVLFGQSRGTALIARVTVPLAALSGFVNNTTLVAMAVPPTLEFCRRQGLSPSRMLIPVSYAAILGGVTTTIGTSTNLTVSGLLSANGMEPLSLLELTPIGVPIALLGCLALIALSERLLPERSRLDERAESERQFAVSMTVRAGGAADGRSVEAAGLRHLKGVFLVEIDRAGRVIAPVGPDETLLGGDVLTFVGQIDQVVDLHRTPGLESTETRQIDRLGGGSHRFYEVVVANSLTLVGRTLRDTGFRARYGAAVLAIHRSGQRIEGKLGDVTLHFGDTLLVLADAEFRERLRGSQEFLLVAPRKGISPTQPRKAALVAAVGIGFVALVGSGMVPLLNGALIAALIVVLARVITLRQARDAVDLNIVILIAAAFGLGAAVQETGLGTAAADVLVGGLQPFGPIGALAAVLLATMALTELVSNNAAAVLAFPVAIATAAGFGVDPRPFVIVVALGASLSFLTPIGYQTNLMVYGLGNYRFLDYTRIGVPLNLIVIVLTLALVPIVFPF